MRVDGRSATYDVEPAVNCVILCIDTPPATETTFSLCVEPAEFRVDSPGSVAEGDRFQVEVGGCAVEAVDDRCGALKGITIEEPRTLRAQLSETLLGPYARYGRLGLLNFARRSFFLYCRTKGGQLFWVPVDLTVLPRYEVAARGDIQPGEAGVRLAIRNNTTQPLNGTAYLETADRTFPFLVDVPARSEYETAISLPAHVAALFSSGDNKAAVVLPGGHTVALTLTASKIFASEQPLAEFMRARLAAIALPQQAMTADADWRNLRPWYAYGHMPWAALKPPLEGVAGQDTVGVDGLPHVFFKLDAGRMAPVSWRMKRPVLNIDLPDGRYKKLYVLVIPFLDNHDMFAPVARITLELANGSFIVRTLHFPGDLDAWAPEAIVGVFSTARGPQRDRFGLLPLLAPAAHDWDVGSPPDFPQPGLWAACRAIRTPTSVMNVVEMDLGRPMDVAAVSIETLGVDPALGVVAITAEVDNGYESLRDTAWFPRSSRAPTPSRLLSSRDR